MKKILLFLAMALFAAQLPAQGRKVNLVFIGNSITQGVKLGSPDLAPPIRAAEKLKQMKDISEVGVSNNGISGTTTFNHLPGGRHFTRTVQMADRFYEDKDAVLVFSFMLGTNDSAMSGPTGAPVSPEKYEENVKVIFDSLLARYPGCVVVLNRPLWYSTNTYNTSMYLEEGLLRLQTYFPVLDNIAKDYRKAGYNVYVGDTKGFSYFKKHHEDLMQYENGQQGIFFLHPNREGADMLGGMWADAIYRVLKRAK